MSPLPTRRITEYLDLDLEAEVWRCNRCGRGLGPARGNFKEACLVWERDPRSIHRPFGGHPVYNFSLDQEWMTILEFYCPGCGTLMDVEYLPPGHPITHDVELDVDALKAREGLS